jgi:hypothetical protein
LPFHGKESCKKDNAESGQRVRFVPDEALAVKPNSEIDSEVRNLSKCQHHENIIKFIGRLLSPQRRNFADLYRDGRNIFDFLHPLNPLHPGSIFFC